MSERRRMVPRDVVRDAGKRAAGSIAVALSRLLRPRVARPGGILVYHRVAPDVPALPTPSLNVTPARFREQLAGLKRRGVHVWSLADVLAARAKGRTLPSPLTVVTFDDGYEATYRYAWPVLRDLRMPATVFLNTAFLDSEDPFPFDRWGIRHRDAAESKSYRPLRVEQCKEMATSGLIELGAHTHTHGDFRGHPERFGADLDECVRALTRLFGDGPHSFAFPFGRRHLGFVDDTMIDLARQIGVTCALTTEAAPVDWAGDPFGWGRFNVYEWDTAATIKAKIDGWYGWAPALQERLAGGTVA